MTPRNTTTQYPPFYARLPRFHSVVLLAELPDGTFIGAYTANIPDFRQPTTFDEVADLIHAAAKEEIHIRDGRTHQVRGRINGGCASKALTPSRVMNHLWEKHHECLHFEPFEEVARGYYLFKDGAWHSITEDIPHPQDWFSHYQWPKFTRVA